MHTLDFAGASRGLLDFIDRTPDAFFAVKNMADLLRDAGYEELREAEPWTLETGRGYFVKRNGSALIAFEVPKKDYTGFQIMASHCDSPALRVKTNADRTAESAYVKLNVEKYGGMIMYTWLYRPLSVAGRVLVSTEHGVESRLINIDRDLLVIPSLAIHMNRDINSGYAFNPQIDLEPLFAEAGSDCDFLGLVADELGVSKEDILDTDLLLYNRMKGTIFGADGEFISSGRLDDLQCAYASLMGFLDAEPKESVKVHCVFDNEEVGSGTKQGAASTFLKDVLRRVNMSCGRSEEEYLRSIASSFMVSSDNAHSVHPNHGDKADPTNRPVMNRGIVIKYSANQKYTTDAVSGAIFRKICRKADVPYQTFVNRSDMAGGSTLGNISTTQVALNTVDIGLPQLAMHSSYETAGVRDTAYLIEAARVLFSGSVIAEGDGSFRIEF